MPDNPKKKITAVKVRMYKMGTGDCISLKFQHESETTYTMLFDCGCISGSKVGLTPFVKELIDDLNGHVDALVITHEHQDHVLGFQRCEELFVEGLSVGELWMGWTENDASPKVKKWKTKYGEKKKALARAAQQLTENVNSDEFSNQLAGSLAANELLSFHQGFAESVQGFASLHVNEDEREYKGPLKGMQVAKEELDRFHDVNYLSPGEILHDIEGLDDVQIYVFGPPNNYSEVAKESGKTGESYRHNDQLDPEDYALNALHFQLDESDYFTRTMNFDGDVSSDTSLTPFPASMYASRATLRKSPYENKAEAWRRIDYEWLQSSANLALRMNGLTNNLSVVLAIEFKESGKVMLFPGDAEYGSWESWQKIYWENDAAGQELTTEDILNRVVFYKVAHHLSHNGTAQKVGLEMMTHPDLVTMATLNYDVINPGWIKTMPNRAILKGLLERTKGRTIIQNVEGLFFDPDNTIPLSKKITEYQERMSADELLQYTDSLIENDKYVEVSIKI